jgi:hypothetical protein
MNWSDWKKKEGSVIESYTGFWVCALVEAAAEASTVTSQVTMDASVVAFCQPKAPDFDHFPHCTHILRKSTFWNKWRASRPPRQRRQLHPQLLHSAGSPDFESSSFIFSWVRALAIVSAAAWLGTLKRLLEACLLVGGEVHLSHG